MKKQILEEIKDMKYLLNYNRGRILSEQPEVDLPNIDEELDMMTDEDEEFMDYDGDDASTLPGTNYGDDDLDMELDYTLELEEDMDFETPTMEPGTKERTITTPGIKPGTKPATPYKPKPGPKKNPKAEKGEMPTWLSFDELGIDFE
jgi:hypothetical protein